MFAAKRKGDSSAACPSKRFCTTRLMSGEQKGMLLWKIANFSLLRNTDGYLTSPTFSVPGCKAHWCLDLWPNYILREPDFIKVIVNSSLKHHSPATAKVYVITASGKKGLFQKFKHLSKQVIISKYLQWPKLMKNKRHYFPNDVLTLCCELRMETKIRKTERCSDLSVQWPQKELPDLQGRLSKDLDTFFEEKRFTDVVFKIGESLIPAHKAILTARSPVFASMFEHQMQEKITGQVVISDVDSEVFIELLRFMYTERASIPDFKFALKLLVAADKYNLESLKTVCSEYLQDNMTKDNIFDALLIADECRETILMDCCFTIISDILPAQVLESNWIHQWASCPEVLAVLEKLLKSKENERNVMSEA